MVAQLKVFGALGIQELNPGPRHDQLANFLLSRHLAEGFGGPFFAIAIQVDGRNGSAIFAGFRAQFCRRVPCRRKGKS
jgi:hypothetical protein